MTSVCEIGSRASWTPVSTRRTSRPDWSDSHATKRLGLADARAVRPDVCGGRAGGDATRERGTSRILSLGPATVVVAPGGVARGHDVLDRHAEPRDRPRADRRREPELALVGVRGHGDVHRLLLREAMAALRGPHRHRVLRATLLRQAGGFPARVPRSTSAC